MLYKNPTYTYRSIIQAIGVAGVMISDVIAVGLKMKFPEIPMEIVGTYILLTTMGAAAILSKSDSPLESSIDKLTETTHDKYSHKKTA